MIKQKNPKVSILILNYNGINFLKECLPSIKNQGYRNLETIVVDNKSSDGSQNYVKRLKWVKLVENLDNYGYAKANNIGAKKATGDLILFLNNDTRLYPSAIDQMVHCSGDGVIVAPAQIVPEGNGKNRQPFTTVGSDIFGYPYCDVDIKKTKPFYVDGAAILMKKKDFIKIGMFDEKLFIFFEDIDLSWRAQLFGMTIQPCWGAKLFHYSGGYVTGGSRVGAEGKYSTNLFRRYHNEKNSIRNMLKNYSVLTLLALLPIYIIIEILEILVLFLLGKQHVIKCYLRAYWWNITNLSNTLKMRQFVQSNRVVDDIYIIKKRYLAYSKLTYLYRLGLPKFV